MKDTIIACFILVAVIIISIILMSPLVNKPPNHNDLYELHKEVAILRKKKREEEERKEREEFEKKVKELNDKILEQYKICTNDKIKELFYLIYCLEANNETDYQEKLWQFNDGELRTPNEVEEHLEELKKSDYYKSGDFDFTCMLVNFIAFSIPFFSSLFITIAVIGWNLWFIGLPIGLLLGLLGALIGMTIGHKINISNAENHNVPASNPNVQFSKKELNIAKIASPLAAIGILHHIKKGIKDISNVDGWKDIK